MHRVNYPLPDLILDCTRRADNNTRLSWLGAHRLGGNGCVDGQALKVLAHELNDTDDLARKFSSRADNECLWGLGHSAGKVEAG